MIWLFLIAILTQCFPLFWRQLPVVPWGEFGMIVPVAMLFLQVAIYILMVVGVVLLMWARGSHILLIILCGLLMLAPCANMLILVIVNMSATRALRRAGVRVALMGVKDEDVERIINPDLCTGCGYNLTGNVSGYCPECGRALEPEAHPGHNVSKTHVEEN